MQIAEGTAALIQITRDHEQRIGDIEESNQPRQ
jgi:hypothetical protein